MSNRRNPLSLSDRQLGMVMTAAAGLSPEKRAVLLQRLAAHLKLQPAYDDDGIDDAIKRAMQGLMQSPAA
jgi:hypothetical protein